MGEIQLELNLKNESNAAASLSEIQHQIDTMNESMGKVRRRLFSELGEVKKALAEVQQENRELRQTVKKLRNEKTEWVYNKDGQLFQVLECQAM